jgi:hypothetical protein
MQMQGCAPPGCAGSRPLHGRTRAGIRVRPSDAPIVCAYTVDATGRKQKLARGIMYVFGSRLAILAQILAARETVGSPYRDCIAVEKLASSRWFPPLRKVSTYVIHAIRCSAMLVRDRRKGATQPN